MPDPYLNVDGLKPETTEAIITRLEERGCHPFFLSAINSYAAVLPHRKLNILELGCGTGVVLRHVETIVDSSCELIGADISEKLLAAARTHSPENSKIRWDLVGESWHSSIQ
jgi:SAM-dependent methyltransferase